MRIAVSGDILALQDAKSAWKKHFHDVKVRPEYNMGSDNGADMLRQPEELSPVIYGRDCLTELGKKPGKKATIVPLPSIESSFSYHVAKGSV